MVRPAWLLLCALWLLSCGSRLTPIPGTTTRVGTPETKKDLDLDLRIFTTPADCSGFGIPKVEQHVCLPHVDRSSGEVRVSFYFSLKGDPYPMPLSDDQQDNLLVTHLGTRVQNGQNSQAVKIVPHEPEPVKQMFVLLIDGSSSMSENNRMKKVKAALLQREVIDAFFPDEVKTGLVLLQFTGGTPTPVGGSLQVLWGKDDYVAAVRQLRVLSGFTHLYDAITYATGPLLSEDILDVPIDTEEMAVTVVALTDGFNNLKGSDTCSDNADRLTTLLKHLRRVRSGEVEMRRRPQVFTVGLGRPLRPRYELPKGMDPKVSATELCGKRYVDRRIDGDLETLGIDNPSLALIANRAGGFSYVSRSKEGLGRAFRAAAAKRYNWFELRYRVDPFFLRRSFKTGIQLVSFASAEASVDIHPSAWLDAPPGEIAEDGWTVAPPYLATLEVLVPSLALLFSISFLGAAFFNTKRALFGRTRRRKKKGGRGQPPPPPPPQG